MPRRDLTEERTEQILDAFERCIIQYGLESSSLEKVAEEAGMKRPIIRHYVGNRDDLVEALAVRLIKKFRSDTHTMLQLLGEKNRVERLIEALMSNQGVMEQSAQSVLIFENLVLASIKLKSVRDLLSGWTAEFITMIEDELRLEFPDGRGHGEVAYGIVSIYYNNVSLMPLQLLALEQNHGRKAALLLVDSLKS